MKPIEYPGNGNGLIVQYNRMREGPNYFMIHYKNPPFLDKTRRIHGEYLNQLSLLLKLKILSSGVLICMRNTAILRKKVGRYII